MPGLVGSWDDEDLLHAARARAIGLVALLATVLFLTGFQWVYAASMKSRGFAPWQLWDVRLLESLNFSLPLAAGLSIALWLFLCRRAHGSVITEDRRLASIAIVMSMTGTALAAAGGVLLAFADSSVASGSEFACAVFLVTCVGHILLPLLVLAVIEDVARLRALGRAAGSVGADSVKCPECGFVNGPRDCLLGLRRLRNRAIALGAIPVLVASLALMSCALAAPGISSASFLLHPDPAASPRQNPEFSRPSTWRRLTPAEALGPPRAAPPVVGEPLGLDQFGWPLCWLRIDVEMARPASDRPASTPAGGPFAVVQTRYAGRQILIAPLVLNVLAAFALVIVAHSPAALLLLHVGAKRAHMALCCRCVACRYELVDLGAS